MAALAEVYVNPFIAADSGTGTSIDPYGDLQFALDSEVVAGAGDRFNIKAGTSEILASALTLATYGAPTVAAPLVFEGYTTAAGDGGIGVIDGNATVAIIIDATNDNIHFQNMRLTNCGAVTTMITVDNTCSFVNCEIDTFTGTNTIIMGNDALILGCYFHDIAARGPQVDRGEIAYCRFIDGATNKFATRVAVAGSAGTSVMIHHNVFSLSGGASAIRLNGGGSAEYNSIFGVANTVGAIITTGTAIVISNISNNLIEGYSGVGGVGIIFSSASTCAYSDGNKFFNCTTNMTFTDRILFGNTANDALTVTPFTNAPTDFTPVNTDTIFNISLPGKVGLF